MMSHAAFATPAVGTATNNPAPRPKRRPRGAVSLSLDTIRFREFQFHCKSIGVPTSRLLDQLIDLYMRTQSDGGAQ